MKPILASQQAQAQIRDDDWKQKVANERIQLDAERKALEADQRELSFKQKLVAREEAQLNAEKMRMEEKQREIETMTAVYLKEQSDLEQKHLQISRMRDDSGKSNVIKFYVNENSEGKATSPGIK